MGLGIPGLTKVSAPEKETADLSTTLPRSKNISTKGLGNRRSLRSGRDDKERVTVSIKRGCRTEAFFITLGGPQAHDSSGRDDKFA